jgi:hypothetical protein
VFRLPLQNAVAQRYSNIFVHRQLYAASSADSDRDRRQLLVFGRATLWPIVLQAFYAVFSGGLGNAEMNL